MKLKTRDGSEVEYRGERRPDEIVRVELPSGHHVVTYSYGTGDEVLLVLHGGPGLSCDYVRDTHCVLADRGFRVVSYDQLGSGESDRPDNPSLWTVDRFVDEVEAVRTTLNLGRVHVLGQSWGTMLGQSYCLKYPASAKSYISANGLASTPEHLKRLHEMRLALGEETVQMMAMHEALGTLDHPAYVGAINILNYRHLCRVTQWPACLHRSLEHMGAQVYNTMWGPNEFTCTGNLRNYDRVEELRSLKLPALLITGLHDEVAPSVSATMHRAIPNSEIVVFPNSSHTPFIEEPEAYFSRLEQFLRKAAARG